MTDDLDQLLSEWASARKLTAPQAATVRASVMAHVDSQFDSDWLWSLLRPVTALLDQPSGRGLRRMEASSPSVSYLQLA